jgi:hypothetical protein
MGVERVIMLLNRVFAMRMTFASSSRVFLSANQRLRPTITMSMASSIANWLLAPLSR